MAFPPIKFINGKLLLLDQRELPLKETWLSYTRSEAVHEAIKSMVVRGAPAIGIAAGYGLYLGVMKYKGDSKEFFQTLKKQAEYLKTSRPTAVNLQMIVDRIVHEVSYSFQVKKLLVPELIQLVLKFAKQFHEEDDLLCRAMGKYGSSLFKTGDSILTHCNAGGLATSGYGTALGVIYAAVEQGKKISVYADETRPLLQGARLTAWELTQSKIPCTLICDNMAASLMRLGKIDKVIVGADRIAANGDTANKIGTYGVAVLAKAHGIPFYVAAPKTTFDFNIKTGANIPIENRADSEITHGFGKQTAPNKVRVYNPAFDVTPHSLIAAFVTEAGILRPPFIKSLLKLKTKNVHGI